jgi:hypothetical protein
VYPLISPPIDEIDETGALDDGQHELGKNRARPHECGAHFALNVFFHRDGVVVILIMRTIEQRYRTVTGSSADRPQGARCLVALAKYLRRNSRHFSRLNHLCSSVLGPTSFSRQNATTPSSLREARAAQPDCAIHQPEPLRHELA